MTVRCVGASSDACYLLPITAARYLFRFQVARLVLLLSIGTSCRHAYMYSPTYLLRELSELCT